MNNTIVDNGPLLAEARHQARLREKFAMVAMHAILSDPNRPTNPESVAKYAVQTADKVLEKLAGER